MSWYRVYDRSFQILLEKVASVRVFDQKGRSILSCGGSGPIRNVCFFLRGNTSRVAAIDADGTGAALVVRERVFFEMDHDLAVLACQVVAPFLCVSRERERQETTREHSFGRTNGSHVGRRVRSQKRRHPQALPEVPSLRHL